MTNISLFDLSLSRFYYVHLVVWQLEQSYVFSSSFACIQNLFKIGRSNVSVSSSEEEEDRVSDDVLRAFGSLMPVEPTGPNTQSTLGSEDDVGSGLVLVNSTLR